MTQVTVIGGGPAGLSAALFTAKNGLETTVYDTDETWMHKSHLFNYLGIDSMDGTEFMNASREQVEGFGVDILDLEVADVSPDGHAFLVETGSDERDADYVVLATGADRSLAESLGCTFTDEDVVDVDVTMETSVEDAYATGAMVRAEEWQAVISAGGGGAGARQHFPKEGGGHLPARFTPPRPP